MDRFFAVSLAAAACALGSSSVHATNVEVTVSEVNPAGTSTVVAFWTQSENPIPVAYANGYYTTVAVFDTFGLGSDDAVTWYSASDLGGFTNYSENFNVLSSVGYAATESMPTFLAGTYMGVNLAADFTYVNVIYTIALLPDTTSIAGLAKFNTLALASPVPEPATWLMLLVGLGTIGFAARRRNVKVSYN